MSRDSTQQHRFPRPAIVVAVLCALLAAVLGRPAGAASGALRPYHEPPWLVAPGRPVTLAYALLPASATGTLYVRNDLQRRFTRLPLTLGPYCPGDPADAATMRREKVCGTALTARVPVSLVAGSKLLYYAVLRDGARTSTVPRAGASAPQRVWVVREQISVRLGVHRFGRLRTPDDVVARAGRGQVGVACCADPPGGDGPSSFDVAADGSAWMLDRLNHRLLVWRHGRSAIAVSLPKNLSLTDIVLGRDGTIYARDDDSVYALTSRGRLVREAPAPRGLPTAPLQLGPDGTPYAAVECGGACAPFGGGSSWVRLTGRPPSTRFEPLPDGLRLVSELSFTVARFALVDASDRVLRAWKVTSATRLGPMGGAPALVGGELVVPLEVSQGPRAERLILRLGPGGLRRSFSVPARTVLGENLVAPLRISRNGRLYLLRTTRAGEASIVAYFL